MSSSILVFKGSSSIMNSGGWNCSVKHIIIQRAVFHLHKILLMHCLWGSEKEQDAKEKRRTPPLSNYAAAMKIIKALLFFFLFSGKKKTHLTVLITKWNSFSARFPGFCTYCKTQTISIKQWTQIWSRHIVKPLINTDLINIWIHIYLKKEHIY